MTKTARLSGPEVKIKHLSWRPPWVEAGDDEEEDALAGALLKGNTRVRDEVGLGRVPAFWWTQNCKYNAVYDIHRLNVGADVEVAKAALLSGSDEQVKLRVDFVKDHPDVAAYMVALRTELHMRMVMPTVVPHSKGHRYLAMALSTSVPVTSATTTDRSTPYSQAPKGISPWVPTSPRMSTSVGTSPVSEPIIRRLFCIAVSTTRCLTEGSSPPMMPVRGKPSTIECGSNQARPSPHLRGLTTAKSLL